MGSRADKPEVYQCRTCGRVTVVTADWPREGVVVCGRCLTRCEVRVMVKVELEAGT